MGRREDCDTSPPAVCSCGRLKAVQRLCVRFNLGFAYDIDRRIIKGKRTRASTQRRSWSRLVFVGVHDHGCSWSRDCHAAGAPAALWSGSGGEKLKKKTKKKTGLGLRFGPRSACFHAGLPANKRREDSNVSWRCSLTEIQQFSTCFEGTFSLQKAYVVVIPMASFTVSSFGDVHKRCMTVLRLWSLVSV